MYSVTLFMRVNIWILLCFHIIVSIIFLLTVLCTMSTNRYGCSHEVDRTENVAAARKNLIEAEVFQSFLHLVGTVQPLLEKIFEKYRLVWPQAQNGIRSVMWPVFDPENLNDLRLADLVKFMVRWPAGISRGRQ